MSKPFCMNLWLVIPEKVRYNRKKDISKPVISGEFRCVSAEKKAGHAPGGNLRMTGFDCTKKKWGFLRMSTESKTRMTEGSISKKMILFAIPLFLGNLFQQLYNTADSLIVGNFLGSNALAAVSSSGNLIFLMVGFINGIAMGAGVYAMVLAERGFITLAFDESYNGESSGEPRHISSPDIFVEDFSAAVDFIGTRSFVDRNRIGAIGLCGPSACRRNPRL